MRGVLARLALVLWLALWGIAGGLVSLYVFDGSLWLGIIAGILVLVLASSGVQLARNALERRREAVVKFALERERQATVRRTRREISSQGMKLNVASPDSAGSRQPQSRTDRETASSQQHGKTQRSDGIEGVPTVARPEHPDQTTGTASDEAPDVHDLRSRLEELLDAYRLALRFVERLPPVGRHPVRATGYWGHLLRGRFDAQRPLKQRRRLIVRPLVRVFVEAHIRRQLLHLIRVLRIETLGIRPSDPRAKTLGEIESRLAEAEKGLFGWSRLRSAISKAPFVPAALAFAFAVYGVATGIDLTSPAAFGRTAAESTQAIGWEGVARALSVLLLGTFALYAILLSPSAVLGFKRKRALFSGGVTPDGDEVLAWPLLWLTRDRTEWEGFPRRNVYEAENEVFALLGVRKRHEFAVDLFLSPVPYFVLWGTALVAAESLRERDWSALPGFVILVAIVIITRVGVLRRRRAHTNR